MTKSVYRNNGQNFTESNEYYNPQISRSPTNTKHKNQAQIMKTVEKKNLQISRRKRTHYIQSNKSKDDIRFLIRKQNSGAMSLSTKRSCQHEFYTQEKNF